MPPQGAFRTTASQSKRQSFNDVVSAAIADISEHGFDSKARVEKWAVLLRRTAEARLLPEDRMRSQLARSMRAIYRRLVIRGRMFEHHAGIDRYTIDKIKPKLHKELERRIMASADLIKLNRKIAIEQTLQRFSAWASSVPIGGVKGGRREATKDIRKALTSLPFRERRVLIDQGHKFVSSLSEIVATDRGAIAAMWHSRWRQPGYNYREDHKERDEKVYAIRDNWAIGNGLMKAGTFGYTDEITKPGEEVNCRCSYSYVYALRDLPPSMLTKKGAITLSQFPMARGDDEVPHGPNQGSSPMPLDDDDDKVSKEEADYIEQSDREHCQDCSMFLAPDGCTAVIGLINPLGSCKFFDPAS